MRERPIRVGVVGVGRGQTFMRQAPAAGMELAAICDTWKERLEAVGRELGVATYTDYGRFLEHDMDAVVTANYFHEHALFAIRALRAGKHVLSETSACKTLAEGVALCRDVERRFLHHLLLRAGDPHRGTALSGCLSRGRDVGGRHPGVEIGAGRRRAFRDAGLPRGETAQSL